MSVQTEERPYVTVEEPEEQAAEEPVAEDAAAQAAPTRSRWGARTLAFLIVAVVALSLFLIVNISAVTDFARKLGGHLAPLVVGAVIAYLCDPILRFYEFTLFRRMKHNSLRRGLSLLCTMLTVIGILTLILVMMIPQLVDSVKGLVADYDRYLEELLRLVQQLVDWLTADLPVEINISSKEKVVALITRLFGSVEEFYNEFIKPIIGDLSPGTTIWGAMSGAFTVVKNLALGLFIALYILMSKEKRIGQVKKFRRAMLKPETNRKLTSIASLIDKSFGGFIYGKLIDSLIIGILTFGLLMVLEVSPYNLLIATFVGVTNVIPVFGPFIGAIPSFLIVLISNPSKAFLFLLIILVVQQLDGNIIGPKILGDNVGVSSLTVLVAITLCGSLWGVGGMIIGVPLFAVVIELVRRWLEVRLTAKGRPTDTAAYYPADTLANAERDLYYEHAGLRYRYEHSKLKERVDGWLKKRSRSAASEALDTNEDGPDADAGTADNDTQPPSDSGGEGK